VNVVLDSALRDALKALKLTGMLATLDERLAQAPRRAARARRDPPTTAASLNNLSKRLAEAGRGGEALTAIEEAVQAYRELAASNRAAYTPDLAASLNNLSKRLAEGRPPRGGETSQAGS
jgi:Tetratricopeptide repeat